MSLIAPHISAFLRERLPLERHASENTCDSYAYTFKLLFSYAAGRLKLQPSELQFEHLDAALVAGFLNYLESVRGNRSSSRNIRLAAIRSFMRFMQYRLPAAMQQIHGVLAIPAKKAEIRMVPYLNSQEMQFLLDAPDPATRGGIRDRAMLHLCFAAGLRVSELVGLRLQDLQLQPQPAILVHGKGRRERAMPLWKPTASAVRAWLAVRGDALVPELFLNARRENMTRSGFEYILRKHLAQASAHCPALLQKRVSPHVLRHSCAMTILQATKDLRKVSLWLGHANLQTTEIYTRADSSAKLETLEAVTPPKLRTGRFKATDQLLASLKAGALCGAKARRQGFQSGSGRENFA